MRAPARQPGGGTAPLCRLTTPAVVLLLAAAAASAQSVDPELSFTSPRHLATVVGPTEISLAPRVPDGARVERLELRVDDEPLVTLTAPPWKTIWDAGDASRGHLIEAVLVLADGRSTRATIRTSPLRINQLEGVDLVNLYAIVLDRRGGYVTGLSRDDFRILEDGKLQTIGRFTTERKPLRVGIVLDTSASMRGTALKKAQQAALEFLEILQDGDEASIVTFDDSVEVAQELTADRRALAAAIERTEAEGGTALYDAIWRTSRRLRDLEARRVVALLSDGSDEAYNGLEPGSLHTLGEALEQAVRSEVIIFSIGLGQDLKDCAFSLRPRLPGTGCPGDTQGEILSRLAQATGGRAFLTPGPGKLRRAFQDVAEDLRNQYSIGYVSTNSVKDGSYREIRVTIPGQELEVVTRKGYYATSRDLDDTTR